MSGRARGRTILSDPLSSAVIEMYAQSTGSHLKLSSTSCNLSFLKQLILLTKIEGGKGKEGK